MRLWVGDEEQEFDARWCWASDGAPLFRSPHGCEASFWLQNYEVNLGWGEITPYPRDRAATYRRTWDNGANPGYTGNATIGDPQWFIDGVLPASILDGDAPPMPPG